MPFQCLLIVKSYPIKRVLCYHEPPYKLDVPHQQVIVSVGHPACMEVKVPLAVRYKKYLSELYVR